MTGETHPLTNGNGAAALLDTAPADGERSFITFCNPASGETFGSVAEATAAEIEAARKEMAAAAAIWSAKPIKERVRILRKLQEVIIDAQDEITAVINKDHGKSRQEAWLEVMITVEKMHLYYKRAPEWLGERRVPRGITFFLSLTRTFHTEYMPYGVVAIIGPWNYPFELIVPAICSALLAGNTVLVKPSEVAAATGVMIENLFKRVPELSPFVRFLHGGPQVGAALVQARPDLLFLTGSVRTGQIVARAAAEQMIPYLCELGGKDPMIVLDDADVQAAAKWGLWGGAAFNAGQSCVAVERVYAVRDVYDAFVEAAIAEAKKISIGYSAEKNSPFGMGPLTFERQVTIVKDQLEDALARGARIAYGGKIDGLFMEPTILVDVDHTMKVMVEETFGPIIPIMRVDDEQHAVQLANDSRFGLGAYVWSGSRKRAKRVGEQLEAGVISINDVLAHYAVAELPFGGVKLSGNARTHGKEEVMQFTQPRSWSIGPPPLAIDPATILRRNDRYEMGKAMTHLAFGVTPQQRLQPVTDALEKHPAARKAGLAALAAVTMVLISSLARLLARPKRERQSQ